MSFHVPSTNTTYIGDTQKSSAQRFYERILERADIGPSTGEAVVTFDDVAILTPRCDIWIAASLLCQVVGSRGLVISVVRLGPLLESGGLIVISSNFLLTR
jgi:hypothetical protein